MKRLAEIDAQRTGRGRAGTIGDGAATISVEPPRETAARPTTLTLLNVTCLDAPIVAIVWQQAFAVALGVRVPIASRAALFATAWLIYLGDRFADSFSVPLTAPTSLRQRFARSNRPWFAGAICCTALAVAIAIPRLDSGTTFAGAVIAAVSVVYLVVNHFFSRVWRILPLKEIMIGFLFAAGVGASFGAVGFPRFGFAALLFAVLCALNCISIAFWERHLDEAHDRGSIATAFPRLARTPFIASVGLAIVAAVCAMTTPLRLPLMCTSGSAVLLALLNGHSFRFSTDARTALADLVLLTPLLALPLAR
jgi:hypothetical protein